MKTLTTPVPVVHNISNITRWRVVRYDVRDEEVVPFAWVEVQAQGAGELYGAPYRLALFDSAPSTCLDVNATAVRFDDQLELITKTIAGAYTTILNIDDTSKKANAKRLDIEDALISLGAVSSALVGA